MPRSRTSAGRPGSVEEARELVTLVSSLSEAGDALSVDAVSSRLGVTRARARKLLALVMGSTAGDEARLPLVEDGGELTLVGEDGTRGRALRLTRAEATALLAALDRIGMGRDDPTRKVVEDALLASPVDEADVRRLLGTEGSAEGGTLSACAAAVHERRAVTFSYRGAGDEEAARRTVLPIGLRSEEGAWYLDGWDLDRRGERTFRLDRMSDARPADAPQRDEGDGTSAPSPAAPASSPRVTPREVGLTFSDERLLTALPWHALTVTGRSDDGTVRARTPYYGGDWLVRMLAACGGAASTDDDELADRVRDYARDLLARLDEATGGAGATRDPRATS